MLSFVVLLCATSGVLTHNWVNSPSRSGKSSAASTVAPCKPYTGFPQVRVAAGELFPVEWVAGHGEEVWFVFMKSGPKAMDQMRTHLTRSPTERFVHNVLLRDYVEASEAPASCKTPPKGVKNHQNYHLKFDSTTLEFDPKTPTAKHPVIPNFYKRVIRPGDAEYIPRNKFFRGHFKGLADTSGDWNRHIDPKTVDYNKFFMFEYQDDGYKINRWCTYQSSNPAHAHIITAARYDLVRNMPNRPDVALFSFPPNTAPGHYIIHYIWRGYFDAIDVEIVAGAPLNQPYGIEPIFGNPVPPPAGSPPTPPPPVPSPTQMAKPVEPRYHRLDHCNFRENKLKGKCRAVKGDPLPIPQACIDECNSMTREECDGVAVVPVKNQPTVYKNFQNIINIPFGEADCPQSLTNDQSVTHVCYPLLAREVNGATVNIGPTSVSRDPEDPMFYGTCYVRALLPDRGPNFDYGPLISVTPDTPDFEFASHCVSCQSVTESRGNTVTPVWPIVDTCVNCHSGALPGTKAPTTQAPQPTPAGAMPKVGDLPQPFFWYTFDKQPFVNLGTKSTKMELRNGATIGTPAKVGANALQLSTAAAHFDIGFIGFSGPHITAACWIRFTHLNAANPLQYAINKSDKDVESDQAVLQLGAVLIDGQHRLRGIVQVDEKPAVITHRAAQLQQDQWLHAAITYDGEFLQLWLNGKEVEKNMIGGTRATLTGNAVFKIGQKLLGAVDDVQMHTTAYGEQDLAKIMRGAH